jgi:hypothetical protein
LESWSREDGNPSSGDDPGSGFRRWKRLHGRAAIETLALENSIARNRTVISAATGAGKLIQAADIDVSFGHPAQDELGWGE